MNEQVATRMIHRRVTVMGRCRCCSEAVGMNGGGASSGDDETGWRQS